jgi:hypothetical protein
MSSLLHLGHGDIPHIKFLVGCFALFAVSSNVDCYTFLARRQLTVKEESSNSWFICVNKILRKYDLDNPIKKSRWISFVKSRVNDHWCTQPTTLTQLYKGLQYLSNHNLSKCKIHPILKHRCYSSLDISRIPLKLRPVTGTYVLQTKRIKYYRNETDSTCQKVIVTS